MCGIHSKTKTEELAGLHVRAAGRLALCSQLLISPNLRPGLTTFAGLVRTVLTPSNPLFTLWASLTFCEIILKVIIGKEQLEEKNVLETGFKLADCLLCRQAPYRRC